MNRAIESLTVPFFFLSAGCGGPPQIVGVAVLEMNPSGRTPLAGLLEFSTDQPARATLVVGDGTSSLSATPTQEFLTEHELFVLGLRPDRLNTIAVTLENPRGQLGEPLVVEVETRPLPGDVPPIDVTLSRPGRMEPGVTVVSLTEQFDDTNGMLVALDAQGDIVWYYDGPADEFRRLRNGNVLITDDFIERRSLIEIDMLGNVLRRWWATGIADDPPPGAIPVAIDAWHHDVMELPSGSFLALATEVRHAPAYPGADPDAPLQPRDIIADVLVEFRPEDGEILRKWHLFDLLDPERLMPGALATEFYEFAYDDVLDEPLPDWTHSNGIDYDEATDSVVISIRKANAVVELDLATGRLDWILGDPTGWREPWRSLLLEPEGELEWTYGQHAPERLPAGTLLVYDNGSYGRAHPPNPGLSPDESYSRAVEYRINEEAGTVSQVWAFGPAGDGSFFSNFVSEADLLPETGHVLLTNGGQIRTRDGGRARRQADGRVWVSLIEVTRTTPAEKVWEVVIDDPARGWIGYRSERVGSLYPP